MFISVQETISPNEAEVMKWKWNDMNLGLYLASIFSPKWLREQRVNCRSGKSQADYNLVPSKIHLMSETST